VTATATVRYGEETIPYVIRRASSRKTLGIEVHPDGSVVVRAPKGCRESVIAERMRRRASWISRQLEYFNRYQPRTPQRQYLSGESHWYLGRQYRLKVISGRDDSVRLSRGQMVVSLSRSTAPRLVKAQLDRWYREQARKVFHEVMDAVLKLLRNVEPPQLTIRAMKSRWGSLSSAGRMTLNLRLVQAPRDCIEYVITHELCHALHRDHDRKFFALLQRLIPDWSRLKERLESALL
jgi:predicted metal-dependent hydrolase